jgi:urease accessory protein UreF
MANEEKGRKVGFRSTGPVCAAVAEILPGTGESGRTLLELEADTAASAASALSGSFEALSAAKLTGAISAARHSTASEREAFIESPG